MPHFRRVALDAVGGWDAWNVTEDAELGLRLARRGYAVACLDSTTAETAPLHVRDWIQQRRRWAKGWMQTALVLTFDMGRVGRDLGPSKSCAVALLLVNLVVGPLLLPVFAVFVVCNLVCNGLPEARTPLELLTATLSGSVLILGLACVLGYGCAAIRTRRLRHLALHVPLLLPYYLMISLAAWHALVDLVLRPHHWHKTPHRPRDGFRAPSRSEAYRPIRARFAWPFRRTPGRTVRHCPPVPD